MQPDWNATTVPQSGAPTIAVDVSAQQRVLRNTYWMLALTMIPTVIGALIGTSFAFGPLFQAYPIMAPIGMFLVMIGLLFAVSATRNSMMGVVLTFAFTFVAGVFLGPILQHAAKLSNGGQLVALAGGMTGAILFTMAGIATVTKKDFSFLGKFLFVGLVLLVVASLAGLFFQVPALQLTLSAVAVMLFSLYILYDVSNIIHGGETNYVMATIKLYLDIYNIFVSLLNLLMAFSGQRD
jgi:modulator of FtsH protease